MFLAAVVYSEPTLITYGFLVLAVLLALGFEFVNGFHDTANAVATVIYTNTLKATPAVVWSGVWNLIGVLASSGLVAFGIVSLLPVELVLNVGSAAGFAMVFSLLISAILWNVGTWYLGLPASSSHTLIGSIIGVGVASALMGPTRSISEGVNWVKAGEVVMGLLISPLVGFLASALLLLLCKALIKRPSLYRAPKGDTPPPLWIRAILVVSSTGVSFAHGSNDGQKGMGLIVLILVGILPATYALKLSAPQATVAEVAMSAKALGTVFDKLASDAAITEQESRTTLTSYLKSSMKPTESVFRALVFQCEDLSRRLGPLKSLEDLPPNERGSVRADIYLISKTTAKMEKSGVLTDPATMGLTARLRTTGGEVSNFIPDWVKYAVALALGLGTMIGYKRIVVTVGEKIGRHHMTYAQGGAAGLVAMSTILIASHYGFPVSTTHVVTSGVAGTMAANKSGLQRATLRNILLAWVLTLPVCIFLGAVLFAFGLNVIALLGLR
ncbi:MAG: inorganic phosphate transporter [Chthoniobacterales bacterium]|nr:inorganic phosphate transporter [Chthoniobacterales bacterium]